MIEKTDVIVIGMNVAGATVSKELSSALKNTNLKD